MKVLNITSSYNNSMPIKNRKQNLNFGNALKTGQKVMIDCADILVTHQCNKGCATCVDNWMNKYNQIISFDTVKKFLNMIGQKTESVTSVVNPDGKTFINVLGGEPTMVGEELLNKIATAAHDKDFMIWVSTNGIKKQTVENILPNFDLVRITVYTPEQALKWADSKHIDKMELKFPCTGKTTVKDFEKFVEAAKAFPRNTSWKQK